MLDRAVLANNQGEYESQRAAQKLGVTEMFFVFVKATIGLAIFGYHEVYQKSGIWIGLIISALFIYTVTHGCMRIVTYAEEIETKGKYKSYRVHTYFELVELMMDAGREGIGKILGPLTFLMVFLSTVGYTLSTAIAFKKYHSAYPAISYLSLVLTSTLPEA